MDDSYKQNLNGNRGGSTPKRHTLSHALSVLICTITSALIIDFVKVYLPSINHTVLMFCGMVIDKFSLCYTPQGLSRLVVATLLAAIWGFSFSMIDR